MTIKQFLADLENNINPGTRGAPARRALYQHIKQTHRNHQNQLDYKQWGLRLERRGSRYSPADGFNIPLDIKRHGPSDPRRETTGRLMKMHRRLMGKIKNAPAEDLIRWRDTLHIDVARWGGHALNTYLNAYPAAKSDNCVWRGKIYQYVESTESEKYGSRSYPRTIDRRIEIITRTGSKLLRYLDAGERAEVALNMAVKGRKNRLKKQSEKEKRAQLLHLKRGSKQIRTAYKIVEKNGELRSVFDPDFIYPLKRWVSDAPEPDHGGGIYCYETEEGAIKAAQQNEIFNDAWTNGKTLVLCQCKRRGCEIHYGNKIAVESLLISEIIQNIEMPN